MSAVRPLPPRAHLIERAAAALGGLGGLDVPTALKGTSAAVPVAEHLPTITPLHPPARADGMAAPRASAQADDAAGGAALGAAPEAMRPTISLATLQAAGLVALGDGMRSRVAEEVNVVQHQILRVIEAAPRADRRAAVVLVTSARPGEGKTFIALNIAASLAAGGAMPVVLLDADGKEGSLSQMLGCSEEPGLRGLAADASARPAGLLVPTEVAHLSVLPYGMRASSGPDLPSGTALALAVQRVAERLPGCAVVLDAPPCLSTSEPGTLATVAGQVVLVIEAERTQRNEVEAALDRVEACPNLQLLLNKARLTANDTFGAYYGG